MASILQSRNGVWRAQVFRRGVRDSGTFKTKVEAETWADNVEAQIIGGKIGNTITLTQREMFDLYARSKERARAYGIPYSLSRQQVEAMFAATNGRCQVTGILFSRSRPENNSRRPWYPSLDRIDSGQPYTAENCRFVCIAANVAMGEWGAWVLLAMAKALTAGEPAPTKETFLPVQVPTFKRIRRRRIPPNARQTTLPVAESAT